MSQDDNPAKQASLEARIARLQDEDNVGEALRALVRYPTLPDRKLSKFEDDCRDWGLVYGICYGLARADDDYGAWEDPNELIADRAYGVARKWFAEWIGGEIEDPAVVRERAIRDVIAEFENVRPLPRVPCGALQPLRRRGLPRDSTGRRRVHRLLRDP
jgi:hypothetical protein